ncbi:PIN domain-containing protein [Enterococcus faecalis]
MKTFLIFDSNALRVSDKNMKYGHFAIHNRLMELINKIEKNDLSENYQILIPEIVIEELKKQQVENFEESYKELKNLYEKMETLYFMDLNEPLQINYSEKIEELVTEFVNANSIETLKICNENKFSNIVNRALNKKAPFRGTKGNSDKGFKDALIWESLIEFSQKHVGQYIYITKDRDFLLRQKELVREFLELTDKNIIFMEAEDLEKTPNIIDEAVNNKEELYRIQCVKEEFLSIKESFFEDLKAISFQSVVVSGNEFTEINLKFSDDYFFYEVNESLF